MRILHRSDEKVGSSDEVCEGDIRNADDCAMTQPSEVVVALEHDLPEVLCRMMVGPAVSAQ